MNSEKNETRDELLYSDPKNEDRKVTESYDMFDPNSEPPTDY